MFTREVTTWLPTPVIYYQLKSSIYYLTQSSIYSLAIRDTPRNQMSGYATAFKAHKFSFMRAIVMEAKNGHGLEELV